MPDESDFLPLKQSTYCVLLALGNDELHGYAIMQELTEITAGQETILPGTLYAALARMVDDGLVAVREGPADDPSGDRNGAITAERVLAEPSHALNPNGCKHCWILRARKKF